MSDQINEFDEVFREKLSGQTAMPPSSVWENIQSERTFGHVVANKISNNWNIFGTLLMLLLAGGSSLVLSGEEEKQYFPVNLNTQQKVAEITPSTKAVNKTSNSLPETKIITSLSFPNQGNEEVNNIPDWELVASIQQAGFSRPQLQDEKLSSYIDGLEGWESAKPVTFVRYFHMEPVEKQKVHQEKLEGSPALAEKIKYEYALPKVERKSFRERTSLLLSFTPQSIQKIMTAKYNLSSSYLDKRSATENTRMAYTFEANLHYELKNHKFFETGINFTQIYEEMSFEGNKQYSNQYDFLEIPLLIGYEDRNAKWGWHLKGGLGLQILNNYKGFLLKKIDPNELVEPQVSNNANESQYRLSKSSAVKNIINNDHNLSNQQERNEVMDLENEDENPFKSSGVVNLHLAAGLTYYHSIKTSFVITPYYRRSVNSITKENALFNERISYMGVSFGTRIKF